MEAFLAHSSRDGCPPQTYEAHIRGVYAKASAYVAGVEQYTAKAKDILTEIVQKSALMHDLGKLDDENQNVLHSSDRGKRHLPINHVDAGSAALKSQDSQDSLYAALMVYSHHRGLPDLETESLREEAIFRDEHFTRGQSDGLRKAMGKKLKDKLDALKPLFISGGEKNGHKKEVLEKIWADWEKFASYAFNKSHATCYSWVAFQTAYLKANYPSEYMAAVLSRNLNNITEITKFMDECKSMKIQVLGPDVNESQYKFSVNKKGNIRFGLGACIFQRNNL